MNQLFYSATQFFPNYVQAIIALTLLLRICLFPLQIMSAKAAKKMKEIAPDLLKIKNKWKDNSEKISQETMQLFKTKSINPLASFVPILLQIPLFAIFYHLLTSFPGIAGTALAAPDPLYVLPVIAGVLQLIMMYWSNPDDKEAVIVKRIKIIMPLIFTGIMINLPVAVLIYTITSSAFSLIEKGIINRII